MSTTVPPSTTDLRAQCGAFYGKRPAWLTGYVSYSDACFLYEIVYQARIELAVEIGTASGFSTAVLCRALEEVRQHWNGSSDFRVVSYDIDSAFYADPSRRVGDAAREQLPAELLRHITFRNPAMAADAAGEFGRDEVRFLFIDASHKHPWPTLDLLAMLPCLRPGAAVLLHDINLPLIFPQSRDRGAKFLFDDLDLEKRVPSDVEIPNIGQITIPQEKDALTRQLLQILDRHPWETKVPPQYLGRMSLGLAGQFPSASARLKISPPGATNA